MHPAAQKKIAASTKDLAFLPAALEIVETPPSPIGRSIAYTIMALFCARTDLGLRRRRSTSSPQLKAKSCRSGRTKVIQPFETGVVRAIHVHDGQMVKAGETF